ncbi:hypothetical protein B0H67DRAFT_561155 [Lasiosphaeris hirsuta]|uniref:Uncharacterized protein n=1 Tax=Lasiosphaeris hirsuta TaxID=260670 RepID=A0AA40B9V1_9PEZI|nr:hypothetical protein B0H67DRAFT_561155 [Lasiosphaeris hirsuta]
MPSPSFAFKLYDFWPMVKDENGNMIPLSGAILAVHPFPSPEIVQCVRAAMGNGTNGVWVGTVFTPRGRCVPNVHVRAATRQHRDTTPKHDTYHAPPSVRASLSAGSKRCSCLPAAHALPTVQRTLRVGGHSSSGPGPRVL